MKVLVTSPAGAGHVNQMVPLAKALVSRGLDVLWAVPDRGAASIRAAGIPVSPLPFPAPATPAELRQRYPELAELPPAEVPDLMFAKMFGAMHAPPMLEGLAPVAQEWRPDLVLCDAAELAGHIVAAELAVPSVTKGFGALIPVHRVERAADEVRALWESRGLQPRLYAGAYEHLYLDVYPPELQMGDVSHVPRRQLMRPVSDNGPAGEGPLPLPTGRPEAPLVYVTMGTVFNNPGLFGGIVGALATLDVRALVTVGPQGDPGVVGEQPDHVRVERYVPQTQVLPNCDVVISHAGSGTALAALELGLPQLCLPQGADQFLNAAAITRAGAGLELRPDAATPDAIRTAVERLLTDASFRTAAGRIAASIASMPSPEDVAVVLESLV
ncbi:MAG: glycosyltransferase family 1 protein [Frankiaceae bacterium]|nr:glycosyltransferase family 1 protein [Frankiaceae bacterium]